MANTNWSNAGHFYAPQVKPVLLNCSFIVDSTNGNGLGIRSLKGPGIANVFMHTSSTPAGGNPNPAAGIIVVKIAQNFNRYLGGFSGFIGPVTGGNITLSSGSGITAGVPYIIVSLGTTTTAANWVTAGLPLGYTAAVGASFIATSAAAAGTGLGNAVVKAVGVSGISSLEVVGDPNQTIAGNAVTGPVGGQLIIKCLGSTFTAGAYTPVGTVSQATLTMNSYTPAGTNDGASPPIFTGTPATLTGTISAQTFTGSAASLTGTVTYALTAPANESVVGLSFYLSDSSITVAGQ